MLHQQQQETLVAPFRCCCPPSHVPSYLARRDGADLPQLLLRTGLRVPAVPPWLQEGAKQSSGMTQSGDSAATMGAAAAAAAGGDETAVGNNTVMTTDSAANSSTGDKAGGGAAPAGAAFARRTPARGDSRGGSCGGGVAPTGSNDGYQAFNRVRRQSTGLRHCPLCS